MGQKVNPIGLRLGINRTWDSRWFSRKEYGNQLLDDLSLRRFLGRRLTQAAIANAENNHQLDVDRLYVKEATVGRAFVMKRFHTRGRGRSARIEKHFAHLTVIVRERAEEDVGEGA